MRPELVEGCPHLVGVEIVGLAQPLSKLIIDLIDAGQFDHVDDPIRGHRQHACDASISQFVRKIETQQNRPYARPEFRDLPIALEEDAHVDGILMHRPEPPQMLDDRGVDLLHPTRVSSEESRDGNARNAEVRLVGGSEFPLTVRAHPTRHAADCAAAISDYGSDAYS
jgi:hypothetical protein